MLKDFFDTTAVDAFAGWVVDELKRLRPPGKFDSDTPAALRQRGQFDAGLVRRIETTGLGARLNFYQKAVLGTRLEQRLQAAGYPDAFGHQLSRDVVKMVAMSAVLRT